MKVGFNAFTDEAREKLDQLGVTWQRVPSPDKTSQTIVVYTENYDLREQEWRESDYLSLEFLGDKKEYGSQGFRVWKHPGTGDYYYWIRETVFRKFSIIKKDTRFQSETNPATEYVTDVLDYSPEDDQWRDKLLSIMPMAESGFFQ